LRESRRRHRGRLATRSRGSVGWLLPDPHGNVAGQAVGTTLASSLRYDGYGVTVATYPASLPDAARRWTFQGRLDISPVGLDSPLYEFSAHEPRGGARARLVLPRGQIAIRGLLAEVRRRSGHGRVVERARRERGSHGSPLGPGPV
jgi:hypothetical protein